MNRIETLEKEIERHNILYWSENQPEIPDEEFDILIRKLYYLKPESSIFGKLDTQKSATPQNKYKHIEPMLSLDKFIAKEKVFGWMENISRTPDEEFRFELKLDGCSGKREDGHLATRGDGFLGEDHTTKIPYIEFLGNLEEPCIGEIIITDKFFKDNLADEFKNSRNAVAGMIGRKDPKEIEGKGITFINYDYEKITKTCTLESLKENWDSWVEDFKSLGFPYDGLVIKLKDKDYYKGLGNKTNCPRGAIAYKFANQSTITKVKDITWQVSRNGRLTPVAELEPVELCGVTISRATCHNYDFVTSKNITPGIDVKLERAGDVIPKIIEAINYSHEGTGPMHCPCCGGNTKINGTDLFCTNEDCDDRLIENIIFIANILNIEELGTPTAKKLHNHFDTGIRNVFDFNIIDQHDILSLEGYGEKSAKTLYDNIRNGLQNITEVQFLASFGISGIGRRMSKKILDDVGGLKNLFEVIRDKERLQILTQIEGVGEITAQKLVEAMFHDDISPIYYQYCAIIGKPILELPKEESVKGKICFTGKGELGRKEYSVIAESKGFEPVSSVTSDLSILVTHDPDSQSSKMKKARKNGTKIINYQQFMNIN